MPYQPTAGDVVRLFSPIGPRAVIIQLRRKVDRAPFFKAKRSDTGELVWPDAVWADSAGLHERVCTDCEIRFCTDDLFEALCPNCDRRRMIHDPGTRRHTGARWWRE